MNTRSSATRAALGLDAVPASQVVSGSPATGHVELPSPTGLACGIWEHSAGVSTDVETDEVFVVLSGRATVEVEGGPTLEFGPGDVGTLTAGSRTIWTVHEPLRKVYVTVADQEDGT
jgi:uncharacterized cupin superfamily protein